MLDEVYSPGLTEDVISASNLPSGGAFTSFGGYGDDELSRMITVASSKCEQSEKTLMRQLGVFIVSALAERYPDHFRASSDPFQFLVATNRRLQHEARKLYSDDDLPKFNTRQVDHETLVIDCTSHHRFGDILLGGVTGVLDWFETSASVDRQIVRIGDCECLRFTLSREVTTT